GVARIWKLDLENPERKGQIGQDAGDLPPADQRDMYVRSQDGDLPQRPVQDPNPAGRQSKQLLVPVLQPQPLLGTLCQDDNLGGHGATSAQPSWFGAVGMTMWRPWA